MRIHGNGSERMRGGSHNVYVGCDAVTIRGSWIHDSTVGYDVKTRAHYVELLCNLVADSAEGEIDIVDSDRTTAADSNAALIGNVVASKARAGGANPSRRHRVGSDRREIRGGAYGSGAVDGAAFGTVAPAASD